MFGKLIRNLLGTLRRTPAAAANLAAPIASALDAALRHQKGGRLADAERIYRELLQVDPDNADVMHLLGVAVMNQGRLDEAIELLQRLTVRAPRMAEAHFHLGDAFRAHGDMARAAQHYQRAIELDANFAAAHSNLGSALRELREFDASIAAYRRAVELLPDLAEAHYNLGIALILAGRDVKEAIRWFERAIDLDPNFAAAHSDFGNALRALGQLDASIAAYRRAIKLCPDFSEAHNNLGLALLSDRRDINEAVRCFERALELRPDYAEAHHNLGVALLFGGRDLKEAIRSFERALELWPDYAEARFGRAQALLACGDLERGWRDFELRFDTGLGERRVPRLALPQPEWQGEDLTGKSILVWGEQGIGDQIWFFGLVPELIERARRCTLLCSPKLVTLLARSFSDAQVIEQINATNSADVFDVQVAAGSAARWLRPTLASFPNRLGYLVADPKRLAYWRERFAGLGGGLRVGFCWRGSNQIGERALYYTGLSQWGPIFAVPGVHFVNLQYDECRDELEQARSEFGVTLHHFPEVDMFDDLDETAALMKALDLVISAPVAVSVQAAALGIPTWEMYLGASWQAHGTEHNPWHPTMRCFRRAWNQPWAEIIEQIGSELRRVARRHR